MRPRFREVQYELTLASVLGDLYELVGRPAVEKLRELNIPKQSRIWRCSTSAFCSLPLHAMGPASSNNKRRKVLLRPIHLFIHANTVDAYRLSRAQSTGFGSTLSASCGPTRWVPSGGVRRDRDHPGANYAGDGSSIGGRNTRCRAFESPGSPLRSLFIS
ncbi:hypothetical protein H4582DRAFT_1814692 [Lactarius indigo]|nr:hypothetical protein H4582DRAFT_1814692 [Lactarius indigo]